MIIKRSNMNVIKHPILDPHSGQPWWKIILMLPELHMETPNLYTHEYANDLMEKILKMDPTCPNCGCNLSEHNEKITTPTTF